MNTFDFLLKKRQSKPRISGLTMVLDKGLGIKTAEDLVDISGSYIDLMKFGWGTIILHDKEIIKNKIAMYNSFNITAYPGGTLFEIAYRENKIPQYFEEVKDLGFKAIEISDGSTTISNEEKLKYIKEAKNKDLYVLSEVGKKNPNEDLDINIKSRVKSINEEIKAGSDIVIVEAREGGKNIGIYDANGVAKEDEVDYILKNVTEPDKILWEAPNKDQQIFFILKFGRDVNLGNISTNDVTSLETLRCGLRGDTLGKI
ncbi:phosphosulfolactate synthase [Methanobrevibacter filiformis]|uniref:Phosphosulfolactate synthase n=1 Tax=Methanobrevibacter filiformis TaxID=55758 RepID=A0A162FKK8_9EURY|nr:phosphosulfolactate synthase [Methanobrevibacter filiformis]KZX11420.1 phosphosulfolactate synthase [Methanobrevibacter filiformis]